MIKRNKNMMINDTIITEVYDKIEAFFKEHPLGHVSFITRATENIKVENRLCRFGVLTIEGEEQALDTIISMLSTTEWKLRYDGGYFFTMR